MRSRAGRGEGVRGAGGGGGGGERTTRNNKCPQPSLLTLKSCNFMLDGGTGLGQWGESPRLDEACKGGVEKVFSGF